MAQQSDIKYLTPIAVEIRQKKYCRFKKWYQIYRLQRWRIFEKICK